MTTKRETRAIQLALCNADTNWRGRDPVDVAVDDYVITKVQRRRDHKVDWRPQRIVKKYDAKNTEQVEEVAIKGKPEQTQDLTKVEKIKRGRSKDVCGAVCAEVAPAEVWEREDYQFDGLEGIPLAEALRWNEPGPFRKPRKAHTELMAKLLLSTNNSSRLVLKSAYRVLQCGNDSKKLKFGFRSALNCIRNSMNSVYSHRHKLVAVANIRYKHGDRVATSNSFRLFLAAGPLADLNARFFGGLQSPVIDFFVECLKKWRCESEETPLFTNCPPADDFCPPFFAKLDCPPTAVSLVIRHLFAFLVELCLFWCLELFEFRKGPVYVRMFRAKHGDIERTTRKECSMRSGQSLTERKNCYYMNGNALLQKAFPYTNFAAVELTPMIDDHSLRGVEVVHANSRSTSRATEYMTSSRNLESTPTSEYMTSSEKIDNDTDRV